MNRSALIRNGAIVLLAAAFVFAWYKYRQPRFIAGERAPDFTVTLADGQTTRLSDLQGKYVLLQFWGSWCGPCRAENPELTAIYRKFGSQGFEILSVAIEQSPQAWKRAIERDELTWRYHTMESADFGGPVTKLFNIKAIPATFLINPDGVIMGVNLMPDQIAKTLSQYLAGR